MNKKFNLVKVPDHVAIIPDGNRRWARARNKYTFWGHKKGFDLAPRLLRMGRNLGIHTMTLWAFSTENWNRAEKEVKYLMKLYESMFNQHLKEAHEDGVRIVHLGRKDRLPKSLLKKILKAENETGGYKKYILNIALDYGGHDEINRAVEKLMNEMRSEGSKGLLWEEVIGKYGNKYPIYAFANYLDTAGQPYPFPDYIIRTSGEHRTSGLLTWQSAYSELYFADVHFPAFEEDKFYEALEEFARRRRRFGGNDAGNHLSIKSEKAAEYEFQSWKAMVELDLDSARKHFSKRLHTVFPMMNGVSDAASEAYVEAYKHYLDNNFEKGKLSVKKYYQIIQKASGFCFDVDLVSELHSDYEMLLKNSDHKMAERLADSLMIELLSEKYRINRLQATKAGHLRWLAQREWKQMGNDELVKQYLVKSYECLREMVA